MTHVSVHECVLLSAVVAIVAIATGHEAEVTTLAGSGSGNAGSDDGFGTTASFRNPTGVAMSPDGHFLYVADKDNHLIRRVIISTGEVTTVAGTGAEGSGDGFGTAASFKQPTGVAISADGVYLYVTDQQNHLIRRITISTAEVITLAGSGNSGGDDASGTAASFNMPVGVAVTNDGEYVYVSERDGQRLRKVTLSTAEVATVAGSGPTDADSDGFGTAASFSNMWHIALSVDGAYMYVGDFANNKIKRVALSTGQVTTVAGTGQEGATDGFGTAASFHGPVGVVPSADGVYLYVMDFNQNLIRRITIDNFEVTTVAGQFTVAGYQDGTGTDALFNGPNHAAFSLDGANLYVVDRTNNMIRVLSTGITYGHSNEEPVEEPVEENLSTTNFPSCPTPEQAKAKAAELAARHRTSCAASGTCLNTTEIGNKAAALAARHRANCAASGTCLNATEVRAKAAELAARRRSTCAEEPVEEPLEDNNDHWSIDSIT